MCYFKELSWDLQKRKWITKHGSNKTTRNRAKCTYQHPQSKPTRIKHSRLKLKALFTWRGPVIIETLKQITCLREKHLGNVTIVALKQC